MNTKIVTLAAPPAVYQVWAARVSARHLRKQYRNIANHSLVEMRFI